MNYFSLIKWIINLLRWPPVTPQLLGCGWWVVLERIRLYYICNSQWFFHKKRRLKAFSVFWWLHLPLDTFWATLTSDTNSCMRWRLLQSIKKKDRRLEIISNISIYLTGCTGWMHAWCIRSGMQWLNHLRDQRERWSHSFVNNCWGMFSSPCSHNQSHTSSNLEHFSNVSTRAVNGTSRNFTVPREDPY